MAIHTVEAEALAVNLMPYLSGTTTYKSSRAESPSNNVETELSHVTGVKSLRKTYSCYRGGMEIEIDTREDCRRKGFAHICGAALILECLKRGYYPSWDAQNKWSVALAEKLGYHFEYEYTAFEIIGY